MTNINFIGNRKTAFIVSAALFVITLLSLIINRGLNLSIDFTGGTSIVAPYLGNDIKKDRSTIESTIKGLEEVKTGEVKSYEDKGSIYIQVDVSGKEVQGVALRDAVIKGLKTLYPATDVNTISSESIGPKVGKELGASTIHAILLSLVVIVLYIWIRFKLAYGIAAIVALFHDVVITLGIFSILGWEISLPIIAAILTIVGYSLNDTIVVFDRVRENLDEHDDKNLSLEDKINSSINQTLSRTLITSLTTLVVVITIFAFFFNSTNVLKYFSGALIVGVLSGTYSSIYIASPVLVLWNKKWPLFKEKK